MANAQVATPNGTFDVDANGNPIIPGQQGPAATQQAPRGLLAPRTAATFPNFVHPDVFGYDNIFAQMQDAMGMPSRYSQSPFWGNGAGRYAYGSGAPYGNPAGRNAPWYVTGANGQGGQYPNPGTILGQGQSTVPPGQPGANTGLLGKPQPKVDGGLLGSGLNPAANMQSGPAPTNVPTATAPGYGATSQATSQFNAATSNDALQNLYRANPQAFRDWVLQGKITNDQLSAISGGLGNPSDYPLVRFR
jgi:hypothetical protein